MLKDSANKVPYKGECVDCNVAAQSLGYSRMPEKWILQKNPPRCQYHKDLVKKKNKPSKAKVRKVTGEGNMFVEIWEEREHVSFVTGLILPTPDPRTYYFSHVLTKGAYPKFRLNKENIVFMTLKEHQIWEFRRHTVKDHEDWKKVFQLALKLKREYNGV